MWFRLEYWFTNKWPIIRRKTWSGYTLRPTTFLALWRCGWQLGDIDANFTVPRDNNVETPQMRIFGGCETPIYWHTNDDYLNTLCMKQHKSENGVDNVSGQKCFVMFTKCAHGRIDDTLYNEITHSAPLRIEQGFHICEIDFGDSINIANIVLPHSLLHQYYIWALYLMGPNDLSVCSAPKPRWHMMHTVPHLPQSSLPPNALVHTNSAFRVAVLWSIRMQIAALRFITKTTSLFPIRFGIDRA